MTSGSEVDGWEDCPARPSNFANTLTYILHEAFVCMCLSIESPEVLHKSKTSILSGNDEDRAIEFIPGCLHYT